MVADRRLPSTPGPATSKRLGIFQGGQGGADRVVSDRRGGGGRRGGGHGPVSWRGDILEHGGVRKRRGASEPMRRAVALVRRSLREFPQQFWLLTAGILVYVVGVDMCYPFETLFLHGSLHISMGLVGLILGLTGLLGLPFQIAGGAFADRFGRRGVLALSVCGSATLYVGLAFSHSLLQVVIVVMIEAAFGWSMFLTATNAMVADLTSEGRRAEGFSIVRTAINVSMVGGPLIALAFLGPHPDFRLLFAVGGGIGLVFVAIILGAVRETRPRRLCTARPAAAMHRYCTTGAFWPCAQSLCCPLRVRPDRLDVPGGHGAGARHRRRPVGASAPGVRGRSERAAVPVVRLTRRWDPLLLLAGASALLGLGLGLAPLLPWGWPSVALILLVSLGVVVLIPVASAVVAGFAPVALRGRYMGAWTIVYLGGYALGPLCGGYAIDLLGARRAFLVVAVAGLAGALGFALLRLGRGPRQSSGRAGHAPRPARDLARRLPQAARRRVVARRAQDQRQWFRTHPGAVT